MTEKVDFLGNMYYNGASISSIRTDNTRKERIKGLTNTMACDIILASKQL